MRPRVMQLAKGGAGGGEGGGAATAKNTQVWQGGVRREPGPVGQEAFTDQLCRSYEWP